MEGKIIDPQQRIIDLEESIADLKLRLPKHSIPASMLIELDDLEEELLLEMKKIE